MGPRPSSKPRRRRPTRSSPAPTMARPTTAKAAAFLLPATVLLGALVAYPIVFTVIRSLFDRTGAAFVGPANYTAMFRRDDTLTAIKNNAVWVIVAPALVTSVGL